MHAFLRVRSDGMGWDGTRSAVELRERKGREVGNRGSDADRASVCCAPTRGILPLHVSLVQRRPLRAVCVPQWSHVATSSATRKTHLAWNRMEPPHLGVVPLHQILLHQHGEPHVPSRARARARPNACMRAYVRRGAVASTGRLVPERTHAHRRRTKHDAVCYVRVLS